VQGGTEHSHGISSSLLSNVAVRTGEIVASVADHRPVDTPAARNGRPTATPVGLSV
jgi:L-ornithine N5-oxygenase